MQNLGELDEFVIKRPDGVELGELSVVIKTEYLQYDRRNDFLSLKFQAFTMVTGEQLDNVYVIKENGLAKDTIVHGEDGVYDIKFITAWGRGDTLIIHPLTYMPSYFFFP